MSNVKEIVILTTYGSLRPGARYRLPGGKRWNCRSQSALVTPAMNSRLVEVIEVHGSHDHPRAQRNGAP